MPKLKFLTREEMEKAVSDLQKERQEMDAAFFELYGRNPSYPPTPPLHRLTQSEIEESMRAVQAEKQKQDEERLRLAQERRELEQEWRRLEQDSHLLGWLFGHDTVDIRQPAHSIAPKEDPNVRSGWRPFSWGSK